LMQGGATKMLACRGGVCDEEAQQKATFSYTGSGRGGYVQECKYKYVGNGEGDFEMITVKKKKPNYTVCFGLAASLILLGVMAATTHMQPGGILGALNSVSGASGSSTEGDDGAASTVVGKVDAGVSGEDEDPYSSKPKFGCFEKGLDRGQRVRAAATISFVPAGLVQEGALGTVVVDGPDGDEVSDVDKRPVIVEWDDVPALKRSRVTRSMLVQTVAAGDRVEAMQDIVYRFSSDFQRPQVTYDIADLVRATDSLGVVPTGTYGTVVSVPSDDPSRAIIRFANRIDTVIVQKTDISKAPQIGDHVRGLSDIRGENLKAGGRVAEIPKGTLGFVSAVTPSDDGLSYFFAVDWALQGDPEVEASAEQIRGVIDPEGVVVPKGTVGRVVNAPKGVPLESPTSPSAVFVVDWEGIPGPGSAVHRLQLKKADEFSHEKAQFCCSQGKYCPDGEKPAAPTSPASIADLIDCQDGERETWDRAKKAFCCEQKNIGCSGSAPAAVKASTTAPAPYSVGDFNPAPRIFVAHSTASPTMGIA